MLIKLDWWRWSCLYKVFNVFDPWRVGQFLQRNSVNPFAPCSAFFQDESLNIDHNGVHFHSAAIPFVVGGEDRIHISFRSGRKRRLKMAHQVSDYSVVMQKMVRKNIFFPVYNYLENWHDYLSCVLEPERLWQEWGGSCDGSVTVTHSLDYLIHHLSRCSMSLCGNEEFNIQERCYYWLNIYAQLVPKRTLKLIIDPIQVLEPF